jgi:hypothetical protein
MSGDRADPLHPPKFYLLWDGKKKNTEEKEKRLTIGAKDICNTFVTVHQEW